MQAVPASIVALIITFNALLVGAIWLPQGISGAGVFMAYVLLIVLNWFLLLGLQRTGRSFGPDRPTTIALAIVCGALLDVLGLIGVPWWLGVVLLLAITAIVFYSTWIEPFRLGVTRQVYQTDKWRADAPVIFMLKGLARANGI